MGIVARAAGGVVLTVALVAPASAQSPLPRYDPQAHCNEVAEFGGTRSETMYVGCLRIEQEAYDGLKTRWDGLPATVRTHCDDVARFGGSGSYSMLSGCIRLEMDAMRDGADKEFQF